jgi:exonuclease III
MMDTTRRSSTQQQMTMTNTNNLLIQWNVQGLEANKNYLDMIIARYNPYIIALQETKNKNPDAPDRYKGYKCITPYSRRAACGVGFLIKPCIDYDELDITDLQYTMAIKANLPFHNQTITIVNIYIDHEYTLHTQQLDDLKRELTPPYLIIGDPNSRSVTRGDVYTTVREGGRRMAIGE